MKRYGENFNVCYYMKEANIKRLHTAWFQLNCLSDILEVWIQKNNKKIFFTIKEIPQKSISHKFVY